VILRKRLNIKNVYGCAGNLPLTEGINERRFVKDWSPRSIDKTGGWFHEAEFGLAHKAPRSIA
jgi:hypothetical protein